MRHIVRLTDQEVAHCYEIGAKRFRYNREHGNSSHDNTDGSHYTALADGKAMCFEGAFHRWAPQLAWHEYSEDGNFRNLPDFDTFIDVKGVRKPSHRLIVQIDEDTGRVKGHNDWAYVKVVNLAPPADNQFEVVGWTWGSNIIRPENKETPYNGWPGFFYSGELFPMEDLLNKVTSAPIYR